MFADQLELASIEPGPARQSNVGGACGGIGHGAELTYRWRLLSNLPSSRREAAEQPVSA
jgi:hypothetical protein